MHAQGRGLGGPYPASTSEHRVVVPVGLLPRRHLPCFDAPTQVPRGCCGLQAPGSRLRARARSRSRPTLSAASLEMLLATLVSMPNPLVPLEPWTTASDEDERIEGLIDSARGGGRRPGPLRVASGIRRWTQGRQWIPPRRASPRAGCDSWAASSTRVPSSTPPLTSDFRCQLRDLDNEPCVDGRSWTDEMVRDVTNMMQPAATR